MIRDFSQIPQFTADKSMNRTCRFLLFVKVFKREKVNFELTLDPQYSQTSRKGKTAIKNEVLGRWCMTPCRNSRMHGVHNEVPAWCREKEFGVKSLTQGC